MRHVTSFFLRVFVSSSLAGSDTYEGLITSSLGSATDERLVYLTGYKLGVGASKTSTTQGVVGIINAATKAVDVSTSWTVGTSQLLSAGSIDGTNIYGCTGTSAFYTTKGSAATPVTLISATYARAVFVTRSRVCHTANVNSQG